MFYGDVYSRCPKALTLLAEGSGERLREAARLRFTSRLTGTAFATTEGEHLREHLLLRSKVRTFGGLTPGEQVNYRGILMHWRHEPGSRHGVLARGRPQNGSTIPSRKCQYLRYR